ncbi:uncharacterized protein LAESUDRAFT_725938 [Laetiporus sulphureus 93-53]|uniref:Fe2OG dioxygenase domain-containing protein n=1 Tax=Laetiporus sulphureus 93-53 TaxID=1314785 RepID=A0A165E8X4_9APHY|nr:uncharacterized protein LAESUDRAFT_725938 [Laetiporus sulphureus 93-53]KZT06491.1 hypothetical protein LAESUDRAFT_725938 [Laetiporus sulphureus 93-53]
MEDVEPGTVQPKMVLRIVTDSEALHQMQTVVNEPKDAIKGSASGSDADSLFDDTSPAAAHAVRNPTHDVRDRHGIPSYAKASTTNTPISSIAATMSPARRTGPPIQGLYFDPTLRLPDGLAEEVMWTCIRTYFQRSTADQVMLFERACSSSSSGLPPILTSLLASLSELLLPVLSPEKHALLFPPAPTLFARQAILNLYWPGDGITAHVDLLDRYGDGIICVSLGSGCVMQFAKVKDGFRGDEPASQRLLDDDAQESDACGVYLPPGSVIVFSEEARYEWTHGIPRRMEDLVESEDMHAPPRRISRELRLSVTFRWLLPGADVVGGPEHREKPLV